MHCLKIVRRERKEGCGQKGWAEPGPLELCWGQGSLAGAGAEEAPSELGLSPAEMSHS